MPEEDAEFLLGIIKTTLRDIMRTVSGQFIIFNDANNQYYIDVDKTVDYDEKIKQKASVMANGELNRYFYDLIYHCLDWDAQQYVTNFNIYEYDLNWDSHKMFREGYLFMGLPGERSTAQPEKDFYIHIMPLYDENGYHVLNYPDEVYLYFKLTDEFREPMGLYAAAQSLAQISEGKDKDAYKNKADILRKRLVKYLSENKNTCFDVQYKDQRRQLIEVLKGRYNRDMTFKDTIDLAASLSFDEYFNEKYPNYPVMETKITRKNMKDCVRAAIDHFAGRKTQLSTQMLRSFGILDGEKIQPAGSKYAGCYIEKVRNLSPQGVMNYSDIFDVQFMDMYIDRNFKIEYVFMPIVFLSMVYAGHAVITTKDNQTITASNLDQLPRMNVMDIAEFKYISRPTEMSMAELKKLFEVLDINPVLLDNPNNREKGVEQLLRNAQGLANTAVMASKTLNDNFELWGEPLANTVEIMQMQKACNAVRDEFSNYQAKYNTPAKLNNFNLTMDALETLEKQIVQMKTISQFSNFKTACIDNVAYVANIEHIDLGEAFKSEVDNAKAEFRAVRDSIMDGVSGESAAQKVNAVLTKIKSNYIDIYFENHTKKRLGIADAQRKGEIQSGSLLGNLRKLRAIEILSAAKLTEIETELSAMKVCYELTPDELKNNPICPHCRYQLDDNVRNVAGQMDQIEIRMDDLLNEWTQLLLDTISDPLVANQKAYLSAEQQKSIDTFINNRELPERIDDFFVKAINTLLKGFEPVVIDIDEFVAKLEQMPPMDEASFKAKVNELISAYTKDKDAGKLRIVVKRRESEV